MLKNHAPIRLPSYNSDGEFQMEEWLTSYDAARMSGYNPDYIRQLIRSKKVLGRKWGISWQVNRQSLMKYIAMSEKQGERRGPKPKPDSKRR